MSEESNQAPPEQFDFDTVYANQAHFESSVWDLKVIFGQIEQHTGKTNVDWHTAVTMPWLQAKLWSYFLRLAAEGHEIYNGNLVIPDRVKPPKPEPPSGDVANNPKAVALYEVALKLHEEMFGS